MEFENLEELLKEKEEVIKKIKEMRERLKTLEDTTIYTRSRKAFLYTAKPHVKEPPIWSIGMNQVYIDMNRQNHRNPLISGYDKEKVISKLPEVISELIELNEKLGNGSQKEQI